MSFSGLYRYLSKPIGLAVLEYSVVDLSEAVKEYQEGSLEFKKLCQCRPIHDKDKLECIIELIRYDKLVNMQLYHKLNPIIMWDWNDGLFDMYDVMLGAVVRLGSINMIQYMLNKLYKVDRCSYSWGAIQLIIANESEKRDDCIQVIRLFHDHFDQYHDHLTAVQCNIECSDSRGNITSYRKGLCYDIEKFFDTSRFTLELVEIAMAYGYIADASYMLDRLPIVRRLRLNRITGPDVSLASIIEHHTDYDRNDKAMDILMKKIIQKYVDSSPFGESYKVTITDA